MKRLVFSTIISVIIFFPSPGQILHVPDDHSTIQAAIDAAEEGDTVLADEGTYYENLHIASVSITLGSQFLIDGDTSHISKTIIDGSEYTDSTEASVIYIHDLPDSKSVVTGFTITGGAGRNVNGNLEGGGIFLFGCGCTIRNNIIEGNTSESYGSSSSAAKLELNDGAVLNFYENIVRNNYVEAESQSAGAIGIVPRTNAVIRIYDNTISNNISRSSGYYKVTGGAIWLVTGYSYGNDIQIYNNIISHNEIHCQSSHGGGIYVVYGRVFGHESDPVSDTQVRIYNNLIYGNYSEDVGGGIAVWNAEYAEKTAQHAPIDPVIANNTIINNTAAGGSGIFNYDANTLLINNIIWNEVEDSETTEIYNEDVDYCFPQDPSWCKDKNDGEIYAYNNIIRGGWENLHNIEASPMVDEQSFELIHGSIGIGNGIDSVEVKGTWYHAPSFDLNGNARPNSVDSLMDIGAIESSYAYVPYFYLDDNGVTVKCDCQPGDTGSVNGILYEAVDRELLEQRRDEDADLTVLCTSMVTDMDSLFYGAVSFNQDIGAWDLSNVTDMSYMFYEAQAFNQDIGDWDVGNVTDMSDMFKEAFDFNQDIGSWDVSNVTDMSNMFYRTYYSLSYVNIPGSFNQDIGNWNVSKVTNMSGMFHFSKFNQPIGNWDVSNVTDMTDMFSRDTSFNQPIGSWNVGNVTNMSEMFSGADNFNQDIGDWDVSNVTDMSGMFIGASNFNQDLSGWCAERIEVEPDQFAGSLAEEFYPVWGTCPSLIVEFERDTIDLAFETKIKVKSTKKGVVYLVPENTAKDLDTIKNEAIVTKTLFTPIWYTITMDENLGIGTYWIYVVDDLSVISDPDALVVMNSTGMVGHSRAYFEIYPNPATDITSIHTGARSSFELKIISMTGQLCYAETFTGSQHQLDISNLPTGMYFVTIRSEEFIATQKLVKR